MLADSVHFTQLPEPVFFLGLWDGFPGPEECLTKASTGRRPHCHCGAFHPPPPPPPRVHHPLRDGHLACIRASRAVFSAGKIGSNSFGLTIAFLFPCISHLISLCQAWGDVFMQSPEYLCFSTRVPSGMD